MAEKSGWKPIPLLLKLVFALSILWMIGSLFAIPTRFELGLSFFGLFVTGIFATTVLIILDLIGPLIFLIGLWNRRKYGLLAAITYMTIFILNSLVALITIREQLGLFPILTPMLVYVVFMAFIIKHKKYFKQN